MNDDHEATLTRLLDGLDAPENVRELARAVAHRAFAAELQGGRSGEVIAASAVYAAFRHDGDVHTLDEIAAVTERSRTTIGRTYRDLADELDIALEPTDPHKFVSRFAGPLDVSDETEARAHDIVEKSVEAGLLSGVKPAGVAAGALYLAYYEQSNRLTQREVGNVVGVTPVTIRHRCAEQTKLLGTDEVGSIDLGRLRFLT